MRCGLRIKKGEIWDMAREQYELLNDPEVKRAIRVLVAKGITPKEVEEVYRYYDRIRENHENVDVCDLL